MSDKFLGMLQDEQLANPEVQFDFLDLKKHRAVRLWWRGTARLVPYSKSASDRRAILNCRTDVRRTIARLKGEIP